MSTQVEQLHREYIEATYLAMVEAEAVISKKGSLERWSELDRLAFVAWQEYVRRASMHAKLIESLGAPS